MRINCRMSKIPVVSMKEIQHLESGGKMLFMESDFGVRKNGISLCSENFLIRTDEQSDTCKLVACIREFSINCFLPTDSDEEGRVIAIKLFSLAGAKSVGEDLMSASLQKCIDRYKSN
jgi:hypothetical protein